MLMLLSTQYATIGFVPAYGLLIEGTDYAETLWGLH